MEIQKLISLGLSKCFQKIFKHCVFADSDEDESICKLFDVLKQKSMFGKKYMGIERSTFLIDKNGILQHEWRNVSVIGHVKDVLETVKKIITMPEQYSRIEMKIQPVIIFHFSQIVRVITIHHPSVQKENG